MAVKIRLARGGAKKRPHYQIVVANSQSPRDGKFLQKVGHYNPLLPKNSPERVVADLEKIKYWRSVGAQLTETVERLLKSVSAPIA